MATIDADAHVLESARTWDYLDASEKKYAPMIVQQVSGQAAQGLAGNTMREYWVVDGRLMNKQLNVGLDTSPEAREMTDVEARLRHMKELEIDVQVIYPTLFLRPFTENSDVERALVRSYNRWLHGLCQPAPDRLKWVMCPPLLSEMDTIRAEMEWAKKNGAVGVFMRGLECNRMLSDPHFFPLYEMAGALDMPICVHSGVNSFQHHELFREEPGFNRFKLPCVGAFHALLWHRIPEKFPKVRWGFVELSAQWIPYALNDLGLRMQRRGDRMTDGILKDNNIWVALQVTDDLDHVVRYAGEDNLVVGTDYGHADTSTEIEALRRVRSDGKLPGPVVDKILGPNAKQLYGFA